MTYATRQDMIDTFGEEDMIRLADTAANPGVIDDTMVDRAVDRASLEIDGYIASRYPRPFASMPRLLTGIACDLARYHLAGQGGRVVTDEVRDRYKDAVNMLKMIARGEVKLGVDVQDRPVEFQDGVQLTKTRGSALADALRDYPC